MKHLDHTTIHTIATAVIAAVDCAEECAYTPFDGDCCRFTVDKGLDIDDALGLSGWVTGRGTARYVTGGDGYTVPVTTETTAMRVTIDTIELWDSQTDEPVDTAITARIADAVKNWYHNGKLTA